MNEALAQVLQFANQNPNSWFATSEDDQPRVRGMFMWFADETGFYYHTGDSKSIYKQIVKNPKVEAAFIRNVDKPDFECLRVTGIAEIINDKELESRLLQERPWLQNNIENAGVDTGLVIFRIVKGSAYIWSMANNLKESEAPRVVF